MIREFVKERKSQIRLSAGTEYYRNWSLVNRSKFLSKKKYLLFFLHFITRRRTILKKT